MTDKPASTTHTIIAIDEHDTLPDVLGRIRAAAGQPVTLPIPDHSPILLTATEFRTLRDVADRARVTLTLETDDQLRLQLASMFGLADRRRIDAVSDEAATDGDMESTPSFQGWRAARARHSAKQAEPNPTDDPIAVSRKRRADLYEPGVAPDRAPPETNVGLSSDATHVSLSYLEDDPGSARARLIGRLVAVLAVVVLVIGIIGWYFMPAVAVDVHLRQGQIGTELLYSVTRPGASAPLDAAFAVEARETSDTVDFDITIPATGSQVTPDGTASGSVTLRNASSDPVSIPAGTTLTTQAGISVTTNDDVEVPAGSPDGSAIGEIDVPVTATAPGAGGNLGAGELSGKIPDQPVYFSNRQAAMQGGTDIEILVVSEDDIANLESQVKSDVRRVVAEDWTTQLPDGRAILTPSVEVGEPQYTIEQSAGDVSDTVTLRGTVDATGLEYDDADVRDQARSQYEQALAAKVPQGYEMVPESVTLNEPQLVSESPDSVEFTMSATASVRAIFDDAARNNLAEDLAGTDSGETGAILANVPAVESWSLNRSPGWWPDRMPKATSRITVSVAEDAALAPAPEASPPAATPTGDGG